MDDKLKDEIWSNFKAEQYIFFATGENSQPRVRPLTLVYFDDRLWILTFSDSAKIHQIRQNPKVEFCWLKLEEKKNDCYIRGAGIAKIIEDLDLKKRVADNTNFFSEYFNGIDDPNYALIEILLEEIEYLKPGEFLASRYKL